MYVLPLDVTLKANQMESMEYETSVWLPTETLI